MSAQVEEEWLRYFGGGIQFTDIITNFFAVLSVCLTHDVRLLWEVCDVNGLLIVYSGVII